MNALLRRRAMMILAVVEGEEEMETWNETVLGSGTFESGTTAGTYDTGLTVGDLRKYKMLYMAIRGALNVTLWHGFVAGGNAYRISYANAGSTALYMRWIDTDKKILFPLCAFTGNPSYVKEIGADVAVGRSNGILSGEAANVMQIPLLDIEDSKKVEIYFHTDTTTNYSWEIIGLTQ